MRSTKKAVLTALSSTALAVTCFAGMGMSGAQAQQQAMYSSTCSAANLRGAYAVRFNGSVTPQPVPPGIERKVDAVARVTFDPAAGTYSATVYGQINGTPLPATITGAYTVNADCTGSLALTTLLPFPNVQARLVLVDGGDDFIFAVTAPASTPAAIQLSGQGERLRGRGSHH